jgi:hypothetical protein
MNTMGFVAEASLCHSDEVSVRGRGGNSVVSARRAQCPNTWSSRRA